MFWIVLLVLSELFFYSWEQLSWADFNEGMYFAELEPCKYLFKLNKWELPTYLISAETAFMLGFFITVSNIIKDDADLLNLQSTNIATTLVESHQ